MMAKLLAQNWNIWYCQMILGVMGGKKKLILFPDFCFFFAEESPNYMHGYIHCLGCLGPSGYSSLCLHDDWRMELHWRPLFLIHHYHHHRIWRFCCWSVIAFMYYFITCTASQCYFQTLNLKICFLSFYSTFCRVEYSVKAAYWSSGLDLALRCWCRHLRPLLG